MTDTEAAILRRRRVGYLLQTANLMPFLTVARNVGLPLLIDNVDPKEIDVRVAEALDRDQYVAPCRTPAEPPLRR